MSMVLKHYTPESSEAVCPPEDTYTMRLVSIGSFEEKTSPGYNNGPSVINTQSTFEFEIVDFDYDEDVDEQDWNGLKIRAFLTFFRRSPDEGPEKNRAIWRAEKATAREYLTALGFNVDEDEDLELDSAIGRRVKASLVKKENGWPKIKAISKTRQPKAKTGAEPKAAANPFEEAANSAA